MPRHGERGETLVEILVSVLILGIAVAAILGLMQVAVTAGDLHHRQSAAGTILDNYAEYMTSQITNPYVSCPAASTAYTSVTGNFTTQVANPSSNLYHPEYKPVVGQPASYALNVTVSGGQPGTPDVNGVADPSVVFPAPPACASDNGVEQLTLRVDSTDTRVSEVITIIKRQP